MNIKRLHATSVAIEDYGVAIFGDSGSGKSDLALRLIDSGATLISDDITVFSKSENSIYLFSVENTRGLLEVRELGIITVPYIEGDGIGIDIWPAAQLVFDAAVQKAYLGERKINWLEVLLRSS